MAMANTSLESIVSGLRDIGPSRSNIHEKRSQILKSFIPPPKKKKRRKFESSPIFLSLSSLSIQKTTEKKKKKEKKKKRKKRKKRQKKEKKEKRKKKVELL